MAFRGKRFQLILTFGTLSTVMFFCPIAARAQAVLVEEYTPTDLFPDLEAISLRAAELESLRLDLDTNCSTNPVLSASSFDEREELRLILPLNATDAEANKNDYAVFQSNSIVVETVYKDTDELLQEGINAKKLATGAETAESTLKNSEFIIDEIGAKNLLIVDRAELARGQAREIELDAGALLPSADLSISRCFSDAIEIQNQSDALIAQVMALEPRIVETSTLIARMVVDAIALKNHAEALFPSGDFAADVVAADPKSPIAGAQTGNGFLGGALVPSRLR